jgi:hypothetical protein
MQIPTAADVRTWSRIDFGALGYPEATPDSLQVLVDRAVTYIGGVTGRVASDFPTGDPLTPIVEQAVQLRTEQLAYESQEDYVETSSDDVVQSFTAGSYSEQRRPPGWHNTQTTRTLNQSPALDRLLWLMMTPDMQDYWLAILSGKNVPAVDVVEVDWGGVFGPYESVPGVWDTGAPGRIWEQ